MHTRKYSLIEKIARIVFDPLILICCSWRPVIAWRCPRTGLLVSGNTAIKVAEDRDLPLGESADEDEHSLYEGDVPNFLRRQAD